MRKQTKHLYEFDSFCLDPAEKLLRRDGAVVSLTPKMFDLLVLLVENNGRLLEKEELMRALWQDSFVEEGNLSFNISSLRKALSEDPKQRRFIETVPKRGYRFIGDVKISEQKLDCQIGQPSEKFPAGNFNQEQTPFLDRTESDKSEEAGDNNLDPALINSKNESVDKMVGEKKPAKFNLHPGQIRLLPAIAVFAALLVAGAFGFALLKIFLPSPAATFQPPKIARIAVARNATAAVISPDGKYAAYVADEAQRRSLWLRQINSGSDTQLIRPADTDYLGISFSPDGNYVNYVKAESGGAPALYQIPVFGGTARKLFDKVLSPAISPDGKQFAFTRHLADGAIALCVANAAEANGEPEIIVRQESDILYNLAWSPDGKRIAYIAGSVTAAGQQVGLMEVSLTDKTARKIGATQWTFIEQIVWLPDESGILLTVSDYSFGPYQVQHVSYPDGAVRAITSDLSNYNSISVTADSKTLAAVQTDIHPFVWVMPNADDAAQAKQITFGSGTRNDYWGFSWTPQGKIVYVSTASGNQDIWMMNADGSEQQQLTFDEHSDFDPVVSPDGRRIVFASARSGNTKIWQMDNKGENLRQVTGGASSDYLPYFSPDGQTVVYTSSDARKQSLWKTSLNNGDLSPAAQLTGDNATWGAVSPAGDLIAFWHRNEKNGEIELAVISIGGGDPIRSFAVSPTAKTWADIRWTADGSALMYIDTPGGVGNIWRQPLDGSAAKQLTNFKTDRMFRFALSPNSKQIVCSRGIETNDVVLISDFR